MVTTLRRKNERLAIGPVMSDATGVFSVEFALVLPILVLLTLGAVDAGMGFQQTLRLESAARAGAQYAIQLGPTEDIAGIQQAARNDAGDPTLGVNTVYSCQCLDGTTIPCTGSCAGEVPLKFANVIASATYTPLFDYPGLPSTMQIEANASVRVR